MKKHSAIPAILAALLAASTLLSSCGGTGSSSGTSAGSAPGTESSSANGASSAQAPKEMKVSAMFPHFGTIPTEKPVHQKWEALMNEKLSTTITWDWSFVPYAEYAEKTNVALASDDFPDLFMVMNKELLTPYTSQDMFVELTQYADLTGNFNEYIKNVRYGDLLSTDGEGKRYCFQNGGMPRLDQGVGVYTMTSYRYDIFEKEGISIPKTTDEFYEAAKKLKAAYPTSYPIGRLGWASAEYNMFHTARSFFWDGKAFQFGPVTENYKDMLKYLNKLYTEQLLDPESFTEDADTHTKKALNGVNLMELGEWFTSSFERNLNKEANVKWVNAINPSDPKYGDAWQDVSNVNENTLGGEAVAIRADAENTETLVRLCDLQYNKEVIELITWGIEGESFIRDGEGNPTFVDEIKNDENPWKAGDKWGMRASASTRPGLQGIADTKAFIDFAPNDPCYIDGKIVEMPWEKAFPNENWPNSKMIAPNVFAPPIAYTPDEAQEKSNIMTAVDTYVAESHLKFIKGEMSFDEWDSYVKQVEDMGYKTILDMQNEKAAKIEG